MKLLDFNDLCHSRWNSTISIFVFFTHMEFNDFHDSHDTLMEIYDLLDFHYYPVELKHFHYCY